MIVKLKNEYVNLDYVMRIQDHGHRMMLHFAGPIGENTGSHVLHIDSKDREVMVAALDEIGTFREDDIPDPEDGPDDGDEDLPDESGPIIDVSSFGCDGEF